jgi:hypothetical protein
MIKRKSREYCQSAGGDQVFQAFIGAIWPKNKPIFSPDGHPCAFGRLAGDELEEKYY